jgi:hypothetical protein
MQRHYDWARFALIFQIQLGALLSNCDKSAQLLLPLREINFAKVSSIPLDGDPTASLA